MDNADSEILFEVKVLSLPETIKEKSTFRAKALRRELVKRRFFHYRFR